jgi:hypothetical protein
MGKTWFGFKHDREFNLKGWEKEDFTEDLARNLENIILELSKEDFKQFSILVRKNGGYQSVYRKEITEAADKNQEASDFRKDFDIRENFLSNKYSERIYGLQAERYNNKQYFLVFKHFTGILIRLSSAKQDSSALKESERQLKASISGNIKLEKIEPEPYKPVGKTLEPYYLVKKEGCLDPEDLHLLLDQVERISEKMSIQGKNIL